MQKTNTWEKVEMSFGPCSAYLVDVMHSRSAEILAASRLVPLILLVDENLTLKVQRITFSSGFNSHCSCASDD